VGGHKAERRRVLRRWGAPTRGQRPRTTRLLRPSPKANRRTAVARVSAGESDWRLGSRSPWLTDRSALDGLSSSRFHAATYRSRQHQGLATSSLHQGRLQAHASKCRPRSTTPVLDGQAHKRSMLYRLPKRRSTTSRYDVRPGLARGPLLERTRGILLCHPQLDRSRAHRPRAGREGGPRSASPARKQAYNGGYIARGGLGAVPLALTLAGRDLSPHFPYQLVFW
jgi:hypothetical protein